MTHYEVFRECFPELKLTEEHYDKLSEEKLCRAFELPEGFALVKENELRMLCVLPQKRGNAPDVPPPPQKASSAPQRRFPDP